MNAIQTEAVAIVHEGLADVLEWLGETPTRRHIPRHGKLHLRPGTAATAELDVARLAVGTITPAHLTADAISVRRLAFGSVV